MRPSFMVRLGEWKYHYCHRSTPQLFNLADDPDEWTNLAGLPQVTEIEQKLYRLVTENFDLERIERDVNDRIALKKVVNEAMAKNDTRWDYEVDPKAATQYVRK